MQMQGERTIRASRADVYNSPGWKRLQTRSQGRGLSEPAEAPRDQR